MPPKQPTFRVPIKSTWRDAIGKKLTDRRITARIKEGWYGEIAKLRQLAKTDKTAREKLKRFDGINPRAKRTVPIRSIEEFC